ncbi:hypothetical protein [Levilactobacillus brevis]|uniref:hypothetical protein n=1 Tax=Levilactobacillus brevis TaxID=1580 RepID=UPI001BA8C3ED|nr:hypothetical protein [Levilactobacillus brevis]MBS0978709.1 hypothetical protein [Levilactobacillus brevis]
MDKNYYHLRLYTNETFSFKTPSAEGRKIESLTGDARITRQIFADGNELLIVTGNGRADAYASFPLEISDKQ